jgi:hypothetical protein
LKRIFCILQHFCQMSHGQEEFFAFTRSNKDVELLIIRLSRVHIKRFHSALETLLSRNV